MNFYKWSFCSSFIGSIYTRNFDIFMEWLLVFFKISLCSCITVALFARKVDLFMHWLLVFNKICLCSWLEVTRLILYLAPSGKISLCFAELCLLNSFWPQISQINFRSPWQYLQWIFSKLLDTTFYWQLWQVNMSHIALLGNDWSEHEILSTLCHPGYRILVISQGGGGVLRTHSYLLAFQSFCMPPSINVDPYID